MPHGKTWRCALGSAAAMAVLAGVAPFPSCAFADDALAGAPSVEDLQGLSIEELANIEVTTVSKRPQSVSHAAAAVYVITAEDIRRSGATSLPEVLRLAPNLEVARINAYSWTVTARGFNSPQTSNKLQVLINGRSVYEPIGSGVLWEQVAVDLGSIDRIEVISGPGGTLWGTNAVNGVINVITRNPAHAPAVTLQAAAGHRERHASVRYAGEAGDFSYRLTASAFSFNATQAVLASDISNDAVQGGQISFRVGHQGDAISWSLRGQAYANTVDINFGGGYRLRGRTLTGNWSRTLGNGSVIDVSGFASYDERDYPTLLFESRDTYSLSVQHGWNHGRHQVVWGGEARHWRQRFDQYVFRFAEPTAFITQGALFAQDDIALRPDLNLIVGLKAEYSSYSGLHALPNLRLAWQVDGKNMVWLAASRAVRTPNRVERELELQGILLPSPDFEAETLTAYEAGWRGQPSPAMTVSVSTFYHVYDRLRTYGDPPGGAIFMLENGARGRTWGLEAWGRYEVRPGWRLSAGLNLLGKDFELRPGYADLTALGVQGQDPRHQAQIRSQWDLSDNVELDIALRHVGEVDNAPVPAYTEADARVAWRVNPGLELSLTGTNLLNPRHIEVWNPSNVPPRYIPRSVYVTARAAF